MLFPGHHLGLPQQGLERVVERSTAHARERIASPARQLHRIPGCAASRVEFCLCATQSRSSRSGSASSGRWKLAGTFPHTMSQGSFWAVKYETINESRDSQWSAHRAAGATWAVVINGALVVGRAACNFDRSNWLFSGKCFAWFAWASAKIMRIR